MKILVRLILFVMTLSLLLTVGEEISRSLTTKTWPTSVVMQIGDFEEDKEYTIIPIEIITKTEDEFILHDPRRCGKYFYTVQYGDEMRIGFRLSRFSADTDTKWSQRHFPKSIYRVIPVDYDQPYPTVEFSDGEIIVRLNKNDLNKAPCFREHTLI